MLGLEHLPIKNTGHLSFYVTTVEIGHAPSLTKTGSNNPLPNKQRVKTNFRTTNPDFTIYQRRGMPRLYGGPSDHLGFGDPFVYAIPS